MAVMFVHYLMLPQLCLKVFVYSFGFCTVAFCVISIPEIFTLMNKMVLCCFHILAFVSVYSFTCSGVMFNSSRI